VPGLLWYRNREERVVDFQLNLKSEPIGQVYSVDPVTASPSQSLREVIDLLSSAKQGCALICESDRLVGLFTERDIVSLMTSATDLEQPVSTVMTETPVTVQSTDSVAVAITRMSSGGYRQLPVVDEQNKPLGLLKVSCILNYFVEHFPATIYTLPPEPDQVPTTREGA